MMNFLKEIWKNSGYEWDINPKTWEDIKSLINAFSWLIAWWFNKSRINCFNTLSKANAYIEEWKDNNEFDPDKAIRLLKISSDFSSEDMQDLIARIIAWEYNSPWRFSLKTIEIIHSLSRYDILLFKQFCWLIFWWEFYFYDFYTSWNPASITLREIWIWYEKLLYLQELWLVSFMKDITVDVWDIESKDNIENHAIDIQGNVEIVQWKWYWKILWLWKLTVAWKELFSLVWYDKDERLKQITIERYLEYLNWKSHKWMTIK